ncbi:MAG: phosphatase [Eubacteriales bacterium]|nr:phosphatase [Eubacteriales bacterium]
MRKLIADLHTHTIVSGHAYGTIRENAQVAAQRGLEILGCTEHAPGIPGTCDPFYYMNVKMIPDTIYNVKILIGSEINVMNDGTLSLEEKLIQKLDYAIAGIHGVCYEDAGREKNTDNLIECMKHPRVKIVSHPDDDHTPLNYERLVQAAKEYAVALEVNNSSLIKKYSRLNCYENYRIMLKLCEQYRVPIIVNTDAHDPDAVGEFTLAMELLDELKFDEELILNNDREKLLKFILSERTRFTI